MRFNPFALLYEEVLACSILVEVLEKGKNIVTEIFVIKIHILNKQDKTSNILWSQDLHPQILHNMNKLREYINKSVSRFGIISGNPI